MDRDSGAAVRSFDDLIERVAPSVDDFYFVQIGANNGVDLLGRHARSRGWRGLLVEPQPAVFERELLGAYSGHDGFAFENAAITDRDGPVDLWVIAFSRKRWATGLASLVRSHLERLIERGYVAGRAREHGDPLPERAEDWIRSLQVPGMTFETLFDRHRPEKIDLLSTDAEGYDLRLLELFDFDRYRPAIVQLEVHVMSETEKRWCAERLRDVGYSSFVSGIDRIAVRRELVESLDLRLEGVDRR